jgi:hypothetical protein
MKKENILLDMINRGYFDQQVIYSILQDILGLDDETMLIKINTLRQNFIDEWKRKFMKEKEGK